MNVSGEKISSGFLSDYEPLGVNGDPVYRAATQIRTLLTKDLGENVANLFATPLRDDRNNAIDWYSAEKGLARPFNALSQSEQETYAKLIKEKLASVENLGRRLSSNSQNQTAQTYAGLLKSIQNYPDASQIFIVNDQPVIAFWGFHNRQQLVLPKAASIATAAAITPSIAAPELASTAASTDGSLVNSSNLSSSPTFNDSSNITQASAGSATLPRSFWSRYGWWLLILMLLLIGTPTFMRGCSTDFPLFGGPQHSSSGPNEQIPATSANDSGTRKEAPPVAVTEPSLSKEALKQKDLSIFKGHWILITSLINQRTKEPITLEFNFNKSGQGTTTVKEKSGNVCNGAAEAKINSENTFTLAHSELDCNSSKSKYIPASATCSVRSDSSKADCMLACASGECETTFQRQ